jgi:hypothetical protein
MNIFDPLITGSLSVSGSGEISENLKVLGTISGTTTNAITASEAPKYTLTSSFESFTGSYTTGSFTGSFDGDGSKLTNIPASGVTGLNLTRIADGGVTASISNVDGLRVNSKSEITGSLIVTNGITGSIDYNNLTNVPTLVSGNLQIEITGTTGYSTFSSSISTSIGSLSSSIETTTSGLSSSIGSLSSSVAGTTSGLSSSIGSLSSSIETTTSGLSSSIGSLSSSVSTSIGSLSSSIETTTSGLSSSIGSLSSSVSTSIGSLSSSVSTSIGSLSSSVATTTSGLSSSIGFLSSSFNETDEDKEGRISVIESHYTTTGSNVFKGDQTITGSLYISQNLIVQGSSSLENITASAVSIGTNTIILNSDTPAIRYAGISVFDSGSTNVTSSLFYDSLTNNWKFQHSDVGTNDASILLYGPLGTGIDNAPTLDGNFLTKVENNGHGHHLTTSSIFDNGTKVSINSNSEITGSLTVTGVIRSTTTPLVSGSDQINHDTTTNYVANQHIDHTTVSISPGSGLTGGGTIAATRTLSIATGGVTNAMLAGSIENGKLSNSSLTIGTTAISLGSSSTTLGGLTSVTSTAFTGSLQGNISGNATTVTTNANLTGVVTSTGNTTTIPNGNITNAMLAGSIENGKLSNSSFHVGTTSISLGRASASQTLTGVSIDGNATSETLSTVTARGNTTNGGINVNGNILLTGTATTTNQARTIDFTGFDKEATADFSDRAYIQHTTNTGGHAGSVLVISSENDADDGIAFLTNASSKLKHNSNNIATETFVTSQGYTTNTGTVTSVGGTGTVSGLSLSGTVTSTGNLTLGGTLTVAASNFGSQTANTFLAAPNGSSGTPTFRTIVASDVPTLNQNTTGNAATATNLSGLGSIQSTSTGTSYTANYQVRENSGGGGNTNEIYAPQLAFHWSGVVASSIMMESSGRIAIRNNPGGAYENFIASTIYASSSFQGNLTGNVTGNVTGTANNITAYTINQNLGTSNSPTFATVNASNLTATCTTDACGLSLRSTSEVLSGEAWATALYCYNNNDGFLVLGRDASANARPVFHIGGFNNAGHGGWSDGDAMVTLVRMDGVKTTGSGNSYRGLSNSSYYSNIVKTTSRTEFKDSQGTHYFNGNVTIAGTLTETSSTRYKTNIKTIESGLDKVLQMRGVVYNRKDNGKEEIGVIAEEMNEILPQVIQYNTESEIDSVSYSRIVGVLIEAIKELKQEVNELKNNG